MNMYSSESEGFMVKRMMGQARVRSIWAGVLIAAVIASGMWLGRGMAEETDEPLVRAMEAVGIEADMVTIDLWGRFNHLAGDKKKQAELADGIALLGGQDAEEHEEVRAGRTIIRRSVGSRGSYMTVAVSENLRPKDAPEVCLAVRLTGDGSRMAEAVSRAESIASIGENFGGNIARNTCLRGRISGKLKSTEKKQHLEKILTQLDAQMITIQERNRYVSCTAYAPNLADAVQVSGEKVNLHIVFRDSEDGTDVYIASPILMMEY